MKNIRFARRHTHSHKSGATTDSFYREHGLSDLTPDFNHRLNHGEIMKRWFLLIPVLSYSCFAIANMDLAGSEFSALDKFSRGYDMVAITGQQGNNNSATINQAGTYHLGAISQYGGHNSALLNQNGFNNRAAVAQYGRGNNASVNQAGTNNAVYLVQAGLGNDADITQTGFDNSALVIDKGINNHTQIIQTGTNRNAGVVQNSAGMAIRITQN